MGDETMLIQYWQHIETGETVAVKLDHADGEVRGVSGPLLHGEMPRDAGDFDGDFGDEFEALDYYQTHWDEFTKGVISSYWE